MREMTNESREAEQVGDDGYSSLQIQNRKITFTPWAPFIKVCGITQPVVHLRHPMCVQRYIWTLLIQRRERWEHLDCFFKYGVAAFLQHAFKRDYNCVQTSISTSPKNTAVLTQLNERLFKTL